MRREYTQKIVIHPRLDVDKTNALGNPVPAWDPDVVWPGCSIEYGANPQPDTELRDLTVFTATVYADGRPPVTDRDEVTLPDGERYRVDAHPQHWGPNPFTGREPGTVLHLIRTKG